MAPFYGWGSTASRLEPLRGATGKASMFDVTSTRKRLDGMSLQIYREKIPPSLPFRSNPQDTLRNPLS